MKRVGSGTGSDRLNRPSAEAEQGIEGAFRDVVAGQAGEDSPGSSRRALSTPSDDLAPRPSAGDRVHAEGVAQYLKQSGTELAALTPYAPAADPSGDPAQPPGGSGPASSTPRLHQAGDDATAASPPRGAPRRGTPPSPAPDAAGSAGVGDEEGGPVQSRAIRPWLAVGRARGEGEVAALSERLEGAGRGAFAADAIGHALSRRPEVSGSRLVRAAEWTSTAADVRDPEPMRAMLRDWGITTDADAEKTLDVVRDLLHNLDVEIGRLPDVAGMASFKAGMSEGVRKSLQALAATAHDQPGRQKALRALGSVFSILSGVVPFTYASASKPVSWFYQSLLIGIYLKTAQGSTSLVRNAGASFSDLMTYAKNRNVPYTLPLIPFLPGTIAVALSAAMPDNKSLEAVATRFQDVQRSPGFIAGVLAFNFTSLFLAENGPVIARKMRKSFTEGADLGRSLAADGGEDQEAAQRTIASVKKLMGTVNSAVSSMEGVQKTWEAANKVPRSQVYLMRNFTRAWEDVVGDFEAQFGGGEPSAGDAQKRSERVASGLSYLALTVGIGAALSAGVSTTQGALYDDVAYYGYVVGSMGLKTGLASTSVGDLEEFFGNNAAAGLIGVPPSAVNAVFLAKNESIFGIVSPGPANETFPTLPSTEDPALHPARGLPNYTIVALYQVISLLLVADRIGRPTAKLVGKIPGAVAAMPAALGSAFRRARPEGAAAGSSDRGRAGSAPADPSSAHPSSNVAVEQGAGGPAADGAPDREAPSSM